jgi:hypothetical protein
MSNYNALYYPFSRCLDVPLMKQLLLLFDSVTFIDPVDDEDWRSQLFCDLEAEHTRFSAYRDLAACMPWLRNEGIVKVINPRCLCSLDDGLTIAATLSDLSDSSWIRAADPRPYKMPMQTYRETGAPSWNIFRPKFPTRLVEALTATPSLKHHVFEEGDDHLAWILSYAAGSAIGINLHLAAADELDLAPVTDSLMHHKLMLMKLARKVINDESPLYSELYFDRVAQHITFKVIDEILPSQKLEQLSLYDIIQFRKETESLRGGLLAEMRRCTFLEFDFRKYQEFDVVERKIVENVLKCTKTYSDEIANVRDRLWPKMSEGFSGAAPTGTAIAGLAGSYISGSGYVLAASVMLSALQPLKVALEWNADLKKAQRSASNAIAYLSRVSRIAER